MRQAARLEKWHGDPRVRLYQRTEGHLPNQPSAFKQTHHGQGRKLYTPDELPTLAKHPQRLPD